MKQREVNRKSISRGNNKKQRAIIFGAGNNYIYSAGILHAMYTIVGIADNAPARQGKELFGFQIKSLSEVMELPFDVVIVTPSDNVAMMEQLHAYKELHNRIIRLEEALSSDKDRKHIRIAVLMYGGMGDFLIGKNWLHLLAGHTELEKKCIDIYVSSKDMVTAQAVYGDSELIERVQAVNEQLPELLKEDGYDLVFRFSIFPMVQFMKDKRLAEKSPLLFDYATELRKFGMLYYNEGFFASPDFYRTVKALFDRQPEEQYHTHFDVLDNLGANDTTVCPMRLWREEEAYLSTIGIKKNRYITINTGVNVEYRKKTSTRIWALEKWNALAERLKEQFPQQKIVQIGLKRVERDNIRADIHLNGVTDLEELKILLKNAWLHFDYDSGLVHLRHMLRGGASVVLMGALSSEKHHYQENITVRAGVCEACEWKTKDWLTNCPRGFREPVCMQAITPDMVMAAVSGYLNRYEVAHKICV